jgi:hypothetical protein
MDIYIYTSVNPWYMSIHLYMYICVLFIYIYIYIYSIYTHIYRCCSGVFKPAGSRWHSENAAAIVSPKWQHWSGFTYLYMCNLYIYIYIYTQDYCMCIHIPILFYVCIYIYISIIYIYIIQNIYIHIYTHPYKCFSGSYLTTGREAGGSSWSY